MVNNRHEFINNIIESVLPINWQKLKEMIYIKSNANDTKDVNLGAFKSLYDYSRGKTTAEMDIRQLQHNKRIAYAKANSFDQDNGKDFYHFKVAASLVSKKKYLTGSKANAEGCYLINLGDKGNVKFPKKLTYGFDTRNEKGFIEISIPTNGKMFSWITIQESDGSLVKTKLKKKEMIVIAFALEQAFIETQKQLKEEFIRRQEQDEKLEYIAFIKSVTKEHYFELLLNIFNNILTSLVLKNGSQISFKLDQEYSDSGGSNLVDIGLENYDLESNNSNDKYHDDEDFWDELYKD